MADYNEYCERKNIGNKEMIKTISKDYTKFSKIQTSMIRNPQQYGVCLTQGAEILLAEAYGAGEGLSICENIPKRTRRAESRKKGVRFTVRIDETLNYKVRTLMSKLNFTTVQDFLEAALVAMVEQSEMEAEK